MSDHEIAPENPQNPNPDWECNDIPIGMLIKSAVGTFAVVAIAFVGMVGVHKHYDAKVDQQDDGIPTWVAERALPEGDYLLQSTPVADLKEYLSNEASLLNSYGWSDAKGKMARIPINEAKKHMLVEVFKTSSAQAVAHTIQAGQDHAAPVSAEKEAVPHTPAPHGHPDHNHATDHVPAAPQKEHAHGGADHTEHTH